jgi:hypothetical protein
MSFLSPTGLWAFAFAVPIVLLFILRLRLRRHEVPTLMFWNVVLKEKESTALFQRLKQWLALLLALVFMALLALALGQPQLAFLTRRARDVVLVIDNSASMSATDVDPSRLDAAKREAIGLVRRLRHSDRMMVVSCSNRPVIEIPFTSHHGSLIEAIERIEPTDVPTDLRGAVELARSITHPRRRVERLVISDGTAPIETPTSDANAAATEPEDAPPEVQMLVVGERCDNVGIVTLAVRQGLVSRLDYEVLLAVKSFSDQTREFNVDLSLDGELFDSIPYTLGPGELSRKTYGNVGTAGGRIAAVIDRPDDLAADNAAYAVLPEQRLVRVCLVTDGNLFLEQALANETSVVLTTVAPADYNAAAAYDVTIFDRCLPAEPGDGNFIVIHPPRESDGLPWTIGEDLDEVMITDVAQSSPILAYVELGHVLIGEAYAVEAPPGAQVLVGSFEHPLVFVESSPARNVLFFAFDINRSDLPLRVAFPIIVANTVAWFTQPKGMPESAIHTGEALRLDVAEIADRTFTITGPAGEPVHVRREADAVVFGGTTRAGFYEVAGETLEAVVAVSLASERESDIEPRGDLAGAGSPSGWSASALQFPFWYYLVLLAVFLSVAEWVMYQRRVVQ